MQVPREPQQQVLRDQEKAFSNFFAKRAKYPRFRCRGRHREAIRFTLDQRLKETVIPGERYACIKLSGLGQLKIRQTESLAGRLRSVTVSRDGAGQYFVSITADGVTPKAVSAPMVKDVVGLDAGVRSLLALSTGEKLPVPPKLLQLECRKRRYERRMARQVRAAKVKAGLDPNKPIPKGVRLDESGRRRRTKACLARLHAKMADCRRNVLHQASHRLTKEFAGVAVEDLSIKGISCGGPKGAQGRGFRRAVHHAALGELRRQLEYKATWRDRQVLVVDRFYPSSKTCSACTHINEGLQLSDRQWVCGKCGAQHDRNVNAAINIRTEALRALSVPTLGTRGSHARGVSPVVAAGGIGGAQATKNRESVSSDYTVRNRVIG